MKPIFVMNLGSTSSKCAIYQDKNVLHEVNLKHTHEDLKAFKNINDQLPYRKEKINTWINECGYNLNDFECFVTRGALIKPMESGIYKVEAAMLEDIKNEVYASHASNIGMLLAHQFSQLTHTLAIFLNAPSTDELSNLARYTGIKGYHRRCAFHALNQKQIALEYAQSIHKSVTDLKLIVVHLGGGISVGAHLYGRIVDVSNALDGEGPMSPERSGGLSARNLIHLYKSLDCNDEEFFKLIAAHRGENITVIFVNNAIYGMTGGQMAPTTLPHQKTTTTPLGRDVHLQGDPIRISEMISTIPGAYYVERVMCADPVSVRKAKMAIKKAFQNQIDKKGFSLIEVLSSCNINWGMSPGDALKHIKGPMQDYYPLGVFKDKGDQL